MRCDGRGGCPSFCFDATHLFYLCNNNMMINIGREKYKRIDVECPRVTQSGPNGTEILARRTRRRIPVAQAMEYVFYNGWWNRLFLVWRLIKSAHSGSSSPPPMPTAQKSTEQNKRRKNRSGSLLTDYLYNREEEEDSASIASPAWQR